MARYPLAPEFVKLNALGGVTSSRLMLRLGQLLPKPRCKPRPGISVSKLRLGGPDGTRIGAWLIEPEGATNALPCLIYYHGGGFVLPIQAYQLGLARGWAQSLGCRALVPNYRLAPTHPFPAAAEDALAAYAWVLEHADERGIDASRIALVGDSAGGNLAAAACLMARDRGLPLPRFQMLLYPTCDRRMGYPSSERFVDTPVWSSTASRAAWPLYLGESDPDRIARMEGIAYASPMEAASHAGLPDAYIEVCEFDCLRDEGLAYAEALRAAGAQVETFELAGAPHGADLAGHAGPIMSDAQARRVAALARALA